MKPSDKDLTVAELVCCVAFTPKGGCPLKQLNQFRCSIGRLNEVAFTPKGGCPLKLATIGRLLL